MFDYDFYWSMVWAKFPMLLDGALLTIQITVLSVVLGLLVAIPLALWRRAGTGPLALFASAWIESARNTPALFQIYMAYFGLGALGVHLSSYTALLIAIVFNNAGYLAEVLRGGLEGVAPQQAPAARSLGMNAFQSFAYVIFPQLFRIVFFPFVNQVNWALLNTSLGMMIGLRELTGATQMAQAESFRTFEFFLVAAGMYYVIAKLISLGALATAWRIFRD